MTINRLAADVFACIAYGSTGSSWWSSVIEITGEGVGANYRQRVRGPLGRKTAADYEVTTATPRPTAAKAAAKSHAAGATASPRTACRRSKAI